MSIEARWKRTTSPPIMRPSTHTHKGDFWRNARYSIYINKMCHRHHNDCQHLNVNNGDDDDEDEEVKHEKKIIFEKASYVLYKPCIRLMLALLSRRRPEIDRFKLPTHAELSKLLMRA